MRFLVIFLTIFNFPSQSFALSYQKNNAPAKIKAEIIDIKRQSQTINFINNVRIEKGDDSMLSDKVTVFYQEVKKDSEESNQAKIKIITAQGNVRMFSSEFVATAKKGSFDPNSNIFTLEENVLVNKGASAASGEKFIYNIDTKQSKFVGSEKTKELNDGKDKRAIVIIGNEEFQKEDDKKDN